MNRLAPVLARSAAGSLVVGSLVLYVPAALACPVCGGGGQNQQAFIDTMIFMSAMPLLMLAGIQINGHRPWDALRLGL